MNIDEKLLEAARKGNLEEVKKLIKMGADVNAKSLRVSILSDAVSNDHLDVVKYLVGKGADVNMEDDAGWTPLTWAATGGGHFEIVKYLVKKGGNTNKKNNYALLHHAAHFGNLDIVKYLVEKKNADINAHGIAGYTAISWAVKGRKLNIIRYLIKKGADINSKSHDGTPLHLAVFECDIEAVKYLVKKGAAVNRKTEEGETALEIAERLREGNLHPADRRHFENNFFIAQNHRTFEEIAEYLRQINQ